MVRGHFCLFLVMLVMEAKSAPSDFSIDHILHRAGTRSCVSFQWLQCTRYCPPKVPRNQKAGPQKRQLGRHPRIPFTTHQLSVLEEKFKQTPYLSSKEVISLSSQLDLPDIRVKIWFQNRRARERRERNPQLNHNLDLQEPMNCVGSASGTASRQSSPNPNSSSYNSNPPSPKEAHDLHLDLLPVYQFPLVLKPEPKF